jgi:hypothetical protein
MSPNTKRKMDEHLATCLSQMELKSSHGGGTTADHVKSPPVYTRNKLIVSPPRTSSHQI